VRAVRYVLETELLSILANIVEMVPRNGRRARFYFRAAHCPTRGLGTCNPHRGPVRQQVRVVTFKDVTIEEVENPELRLPR